MAASIRTTVFDIIERRSPSSLVHASGRSGGNALERNTVPNDSEVAETGVGLQRGLEGTEHDDVGVSNDEFKLPKLSSLAIVIATSNLLQISFFIIVSSSNLYAEHLGGGSTFSGLVIGIPTVFSGIALIPLMKLDKGGYKRPLHVACFTSLLGNIIYALAYKCNVLYLILIGRIVSGFSFTFWMYAKKYCSDPRLVGVRRRTTLAGWLVVGQGLGFTLGPFLGGVLYKTVGFGDNRLKQIFNGFTSPGWVMAAVWLVFWAIVTVFFEDAESSIPNPMPNTSASSESNGIVLQNMASIDDPHLGVIRGDATAAPQATMPAVESERFRISFGQWGVIVTMCWFAMTCFFILGAWESNIPIFTASAISPLHWTPFDAGNLIALGGITIFPFLFLNLYFGPRVQDRFTLAAGSFLGFIGLVVFLAVLSVSPAEAKFPVLFISWVLVALGFNLASTGTLSLLSKQLPGEWNGRLSLAIQYSNYLGRVTGAVWGGSGVVVGMKGYVGLEIGLVGIGAVLFSTLWKNLKAKTG